MKKTFQVKAINLFEGEEIGIFTKLLDEKEAKRYEQLFKDRGYKDIRTEEHK